MNKLFWKVRIILIVVNLLIAGAFAYFGWFLDQKYQTGYALMFTFLIVSFPIAQVIIHRLIKKVV